MSHRTAGPMPFKFTRVNTQQNSQSGSEAGVGHAKAEGEARPPAVGVKISRSGARTAEAQEEQPLPESMLDKLENAASRVTREQLEQAMVDEGILDRVDPG